MLWLNIVALMHNISYLYKIPFRLHETKGNEKMILTNILSKIFLIIMPNKSFVEMGKEKKAIISHYDTCDVKILVIICFGHTYCCEGWTLCQDQESCNRCSGSCRITNINFHDLLHKQKVKSFLKINILNNINSFSLKFNNYHDDQTQLI